MAKSYVLLLGIVVVLAGCRKQEQSKNYKQYGDSQILYDEQKAKQQKLYHMSQTVHHQKEIDADVLDIGMINVDYVWTIDLPIPLQATEKKNYYHAEPTTYSVGYTVALDHEDLIDFYKKQMELLGWHCWWEADGIESLLMFEKHHKQCAISIRPSASRKKQDIIVLQKTV